MNNFLQDDIKSIVNRLQNSERFSGKRILLTGGMGFLGTYFSAMFNELNINFKKIGLKPCEVVVLDNFVTSDSNKSTDFNYENIFFLHHDIIKPFYPERPVDYIIHAAGIASPYYYNKFPLETLEVATTGLKNVLEIAKRNKESRLLFFSSSEIYGDPSPQSVPTSEDYRGNVSCTGSRACYDESKRLGETLVQIYYKQFGVHGCSARPFNVIGPGMKKTDYRVLPNFASRIFDGKSVQIYGNGNQTRTFCYITDAMVGFTGILLDGHSGESYNIGNPEPEISMIDFAHRIGKVLGKEVKFDIIEYPDSYPSDEPNRRCPDISKSNRHFGYHPIVRLDDGLSSFFRWAEKAYT